jgi:hypothetical protein
MRGVLWLAFTGGCEFDLTDDDPTSYPTFGDSGGGLAQSGESCAITAECDAGLRCNGFVCTGGCIQDDECPEEFACATHTGSAQHTDYYDCYERCVVDDECKAGARCTSAGDCVRS